MIPETKVCRKCGVEQPEKEFPRTTSLKGVQYLKSYCKECKRKMNKVLYNSKKENNVNMYLIDDTFINNSY